MASVPVKETDPTIGKLVSDMTQQVSTLVKKEIELAKSELKVSVKAGGTGIGLFAGAAFLAVMAFIMLSVAIAYFIHWNGSGLSLHWAFLIVFALYVALAGLLAMIGIRKVKQVHGPERAIRQAQETKAILKRS